jgi:D-glutamate cyclase
MIIPQLRDHRNRKGRTAMDSDLNGRENVLNVIGENIDRLCTLEMRAPGSSHGVIHNLYDAARQVLGEPLAMQAARRLADRVIPGDFVIIATGAGHPLYLPEGETDGPLVAVALARIIAEGLRAVPVLITEQEHVRNVKATAIAGGLGIRPLDEISRVAATIDVLPFPADDAEAIQMAGELLDNLEPTAVVAVEKLAPNRAGVAHTATGMPAGDQRARAERLFEGATERQILTIGVGDNGNEIGFGLIEEAVQRFKPFGRTCQCPCGQGLASAVATDILVVAGTSNWGAYGVEACLAAILEDAALIHSNDAERFMLYENVRAGGVDGSTARQMPLVDGTSPEVQTSILELMRACVQHGLSEPFQRPF